MRQENQGIIRRIYNLLCENMPDITYLTEILEKQIQSNMNIQISQMNRVFIMLNIHSYK